MWEPRLLTILWASTACYRDSFTFFYTLNLTVSPLYMPPPQTYTHTHTHTHTHAHAHVCWKKIDFFWAQIVLVADTPLNPFMPAHSNEYPQVRGWYYIKMLKSCKVFNKLTCVILWQWSSHFCATVHSIFHWRQNLWLSENTWDCFAFRLIFEVITI
jgi:hypothetical protein